MRVDRFLNEELPEFEHDDAQMYLDLYRDADAEDPFDHFEGQRETNMSSCARCRAVPAGRKAMHKSREKSRSSRCCMNGPCKIGSHSPDCRAGACAQALAGSGAIGGVLSAQAVKSTAPSRSVAAELWCLTITHKILTLLITSQNPRLG